MEASRNATETSVGHLAQHAAGRDKASKWSLVMKRLGLLVICALYIGGVVSVSQAGLITLTGQSLTDLLGGASPQPLGILLETDMNNGSLLGLGGIGLLLRRRRRA